jgi:hypothetical protein
MLVCLSLTACQTMGSAGINLRSVPCENLNPIYWSKNDTRPTQEQITEYNGVYVAHCRKDAAKT